MSGIFGIFNRNGKPVEEKIVNTMLDAASYWKPDERDKWIDGPVALGHAMLWNTPESKYEHLPLEKDAYVLTMDARIDNRDELIKELDLPNLPLLEIGDSEFILAAYLKWGEECPKHLLGDFTFAIWDAKKQQLFCARDHVGIKPFYYYLDDEKFIFANDIESIVNIPNFSQEINDKTMIDFFKFRQLKHPTRTFFKDIIKLEAATTIIINSKTEKLTKYWDFEKTAKIHFDTDDEYIKRLRELLIQSVECRLRSRYPIASHLSGGLDSSAISTISARYLHKYNRQLYTYNWLHSPSEKENKEDFDFSMSRQVAEQENTIHQYIDFTSQDVLDASLKHDIRFNDTIIFWYEHFLRQKARINGVRTILSGWGGDELISNHGGSYATGLFWKGHFIKAYKVLYAYNNKNNKNVSILKFYYRLFRLGINYLVFPGLSSYWYCKLARMDCDQFDYGQVFKKYYKDLRGDLPSYERTVKNKGLYLNQISLLTNGHLLTRIESWASGGRRDNIEYYYPLLDKRIIEFALGIPEKYFFNDGEKRYIFKKSLTGILPNSLLSRNNTKYEPNRLRKLHSMQKEMVKRWQQTDFEVQLEKSKYIDKYKVFEVLEQIEHDNTENIDDFLDIIELTILTLKVR